MVCPSGFYTPPSTSNPCRLTLSGSLTDLNDTSLQQPCYACPAHAHCDRALASPSFNYFLLENADTPAEIILCPRGYCQPVGGLSAGLNNQSPCTDGRAGPLCTGCDVDRVTSLRFDDVIECPESRDARCLDYTSSSVVIIVFTIMYVVILLLLVRPLTNESHLVTPLVSRRGHVTASSALVGCLLSTTERSPLVGRVAASTGHVTDNRSPTGCNSAASASHVTDNRSPIGSPESPHMTDNPSLIGRVSPATSGNHVTASRSLIGCVLPLVFFHQLLPSVYPRLMASSYWWDEALQFVTSLFHLYPAVFAAGWYCATRL